MKPKQSEIHPCVCLLDFSLVGVADMAKGKVLKSWVPPPPPNRNLYLLPTMSRGDLGDMLSPGDLTRRVQWVYSLTGG